MAKIKMGWSTLLCVGILSSCTLPEKRSAIPVATPVCQQAAVSKAPIVIVGAGLAGLTAAYKLKQQGIRALILESSSRIGGRVQSVYFKSGNYAEGHMEEYFERSPAVTLLRELGFRDSNVEKLVDSEKQLAMDVAHSSVRIDGKIYPYQGEGDREAYLKGIFSPAEIKALMKWNDRGWQTYEKLHAAFFDADNVTRDDATLPKELQALQKISFKDYVLQAKLPHRVAEWIRVTIEPETAIEWDKISALDGIDEFRLFFNTPTGWGEKNYHVVGGNDRFIEVLSQQLDSTQISTHSQVTAIERHSDGKIKVRYLKNGRDYQDIETQTVLVTVPLYALKNIQFIPSLSAKKQQAIQSTRFGSYIKIHITLDERAEKLWDQDGSILTLLSDSPAGSIYEATDFQKKWPGKKPTPEIILTLLVHAHYATDMSRQSKNADEMRELAHQSLEKLFPGVSKYILGTELFVYPTAVAYWPFELGRSRFDALSQELRRPEGGIYIGGDTTEDSHSEGAVRAGLRMVKQILNHK